MIERPNYYAIIPANVRYDNRLTDKSKLLYGEISALCNKNGKCWAKNDYFASLYETSPRTITRLIKELNDYEYITIDFNDNGDRQICLGRVDKIVQNSIDKNVYHNNTSNINNTSINKKIIIKENFDKFWKAYPKKKDKAKAEKWFEKNNPDEELMELILLSLETQKKLKEWKKDNGQYIPLPTTWLNGKRWEDTFDENEFEESEEDIDKMIEEELKRRESLYDNR